MLKLTKQLLTCFLLLFLTQQIFAGRYYDSKTGRWISVDPMAEKYSGWSGYNYTLNNPIKNIDKDGKVPTTFIEADGTVRTIDDGSNAVFNTVGEGVNQHYEYAGMDITNNNGSNVISITTAIQEQQNMNLINPSLQEDDNGITHCNAATQNVQSTMSSIIGVDVTNRGSANQMANEIKNSDNYQNVSQSKAQQNANNGGLSIVMFENSKGSGHAATYSVGTNQNKGTIANIGPSKYTGFVPLNQAISKKKEKEYYILKIPNN
jgi:uncharacterized protein RhaS with RHS repeats